MISIKHFSSAQMATSASSFDEATEDRATLRVLSLHNRPEIRTTVDATEKLSTISSSPWPRPVSSAINYTCSKTYSIAAGHRYNAKCILTDRTRLDNCGTISSAPLYHTTRLNSGSSPEVHNPIFGIDSPNKVATTANHITLLAALRRPFLAHQIVLVPARDISKWPRRIRSITNKLMYPSRHHRRPSPTSLPPPEAYRNLYRAVFLGEFKETPRMANTIRQIEGKLIRLIAARKYVFYHYFISLLLEARRRLTLYGEGGHGWLDRVTRGTSTGSLVSTDNDKLEWRNFGSEDEPFIRSEFASSLARCIGGEELERELQKAEGLHPHLKDDFEAGEGDFTENFKSGVVEYLARCAKERAHFEEGEVGDRESEEEQARLEEAHRQKRRRIG